MIIFIHIVSGCFHTINRRVKFVGTENIWPAKPKIFAIWPFKLKASQPLYMTRVTSLLVKVCNYRMYSG